MSNVVLKIKNISKMYDLGEVGTGTLSKDLNRTWAKLRGKPDPYATIAEINDRTKASSSGVVWALKDINFDVEKGEVLGIIGRNGAGKSTLLKVLSQITSPTTGKIKIKGRVASLLEVGTGMHPEMTARENIYLNGAIMGMTRHEINSKLEEIVDFAGITKYIDTPIKRFSSGMQVRLGFAVAAFLEPEILIVDEVLAVGDAEFQKRAIGKMKEVSEGGGRTVLFVSHNMASVKSLCTKCMWIDNGEIREIGETDKIISKYLLGDTSLINYTNTEYKNKGFIIHEMGVRALNKHFEDPISREDEIEFYFKYTNNNPNKLHFTIKLKADDGQYVMTTSTGHYPNLINEGSNTTSMIIPKMLLNDRTFYLDLFVIENKKDKLLLEKDVLSFNVMPENRPIGSWMGRELGYIRGQFDWSTKGLDL